MTKFEISEEDFEPRTVEFSVKGTPYVLHEASAASAKKYNNERTKRLIFNQNGDICGVRDLGDLEPMLVQMCVKTPDGNAIPASIIETWGNRLVSRLFTVAEEISGLKQESPLSEQIVQALNRTDSPVSLKEFKQWTASLPAGFDLLKKEAESWGKEDNTKNS